MKIKIAALALLAVPLLVGCNSTEDPDFTETTIVYKGRSIDCITWDGSHGEVGLTCDFVGFHQQSIAP